jgi:hypothetical protein
LLRAGSSLPCQRMRGFVRQLLEEAEPGRRCDPGVPRDELPTPGGGGRARRGEPRGRRGRGAGGARASVGTAGNLAAHRVAAGVGHPGLPEPVEEPSPEDPGGGSGRGTARVDRRHGSAYPRIPYGRGTSSAPAPPTPARGHGAPLLPRDGREGDRRDARRERRDRQDAALPGTQGARGHARRRGGGGGRCPTSIAV